MDEDKPVKTLTISDDFEIKKAIKVDDFLIALWDIKQLLREERKYKNNKLAVKLENKVNEILNEHDINLDIWII